MMFWALLAGFVGSVGGFVWSVSRGPSNAEELPRVPVFGQTIENPSIQPDTLSSPTRACSPTPGSIRTRASPGERPRRRSCPATDPTRLNFYFRSGAVKLEATLRSDYAAMREMIYGGIPSFDALLESLKEIAAVFASWTPQEAG